MNRVTLVDPANATGKTSELFTAIKSKLGMVPNLMKVLGNSPAALEGYLGLSGAVAHGALDGKSREAIALSVGQKNSCQYCVSAHTLLGKKAGLTDQDVLAARKGEASSPKLAAVVSLANIIVEKRGLVSESDLQAARSAGVSDAEIVETVANVALNIYTNYINHLAETQIDFPVVQL